MRVYDVLGREVVMLVNKEQSAGWKDVRWNANGVASGIYFYRLIAGNFIEMEKCWWKNNLHNPAKVLNLHKVLRAKIFLEVA
jgi:hypothetical protein